VFDVSFYVFFFKERISEVQILHMFNLSDISLELGILSYLIYLLTAIGLTRGGSSTVHIYTQTHYNETEYPERNINNNKNT